MTTRLADCSSKDGAFLQRATTIVSATQGQNVTLSFELSPELPKGFSGTDVDLTILPSEQAEAAFTDWVHDRPIPLPAQGCSPGSSCRATIRAPGLAQVKCEKTTWHIDGAMLRSGNSTWGSFQKKHKPTEFVNATTIYNPAFSVDLIISPNTAANVSLEMFSVQADYIQIINPEGGTFTSRQCSFAPAILEYEVEFSGGNLVLPELIPSNRVIAIANNTLGWQTKATKPLPQVIT